MRLKIALIAAPFIPVPPPKYGGTELFIAQLADALAERGHEPIVYANGASTVQCEVRACYPEADWPIDSPDDARLKNQIHTAWALRDAITERFDIIHLNDATGIPMTPFLATSVVYTLHHPHESMLADLYARFPDIRYISISHNQGRAERPLRTHTIHHGIRLEDYQFVPRKQSYLSFLGRMVPIKGAHLAIQVARSAGVPLKLAGEVQPMFRDYWDAEIAPHIDGRFIEYLGEADHALKNELLGNSMACLFPIQWNEPFGLVMIEAMACGTPVLALPGGAVEEVVRDGVNGWVCNDVTELATRVRELAIDPDACRRDVQERFSVSRMVRAYERVYYEASAVRAPRRDVA